MLVHRDGCTTKMLPHKRTSTKPMQSQYVRKISDEHKLTAAVTARTVVFSSLSLSHARSPRSVRESLKASRVRIEFSSWPDVHPGLFLLNYIHKSKLLLIAETIHTPMMFFILLNKQYQ